MSFRALRVLPAVFLALVPAAVAAAETPSGLPLPRFVTTRSTPINVRVGPGTKYDVSWIYKVAGTPVEIIQEFDVWRKIRDVDGSVGWVHQNMLSGKRTAMMAPWKQGQSISLYDSPSLQGGVVAKLAAGVVGDVSSCTGDWCEITAGGYDGYIEQTQLWGVYPGEAVD